MRTTNFVLKAIFSVAVLSLSTLSLAQEGHHPSTTEGKNTLGMSQQMDHSQHSAQEHEKHVQMMEQMNHSEHMNYQQVQSENTQQKDSTEKSQNKNAQKGDQHAHH